MTLKLTLRQWIVLVVAAPLITVGILYAACQSTTPPPTPLSAFVPQGSLLSIEANDFAALLSSWTASSEQRRWLTSDNYAAFSRSRLFARLGEAQDQFATSAGLPPDMQFLQQIAGHQSIFAWYDIGNLQFLYITRMPSAAAEQTQLLQLRSKFQLRKAGDDSFYLRTQGEPERTVAFAVHGDYLLLATREDLIANALLLMQHQGDASLHTEPWYTTSVAAAKRPSSEQPALRMTLNLARILPTPYFRSYWVQQNITELKQFSSAVSDLYLGQQSFREDRVLIPTTSDNLLPTADLAPLLQLLPANAGVYRATAQPTTPEIVDALNDKLLSRSPSSFRDQHLAPVADLSVQNAGSPTDLDTRIDTLPIPQQPLTDGLASLRALLNSTHPDAMLVYSSTTNATVPATLFLPIHNVVILSAAAPWNPESVQSALTEALSPHLTIGRAGLAWQSRQQGTATWFQLSGLQTLSFAVQGNRCILATDSESLIQFLRVSNAAAAKPIIASTIAGFHHTAERPNLARLTSLFDHTVSTPQSDDTAPAFFSRNITSLGTTFQSLDSETFTETPAPSTDQRPNTVHQTVLYQWRPKPR
ncbi:MAG TPA: hypothetical protein VNY78_04260 [Edaphobacter sp.]|nr:hypothetical protein [Edaphobacter sp.]